MEQRAEENRVGDREGKERGQTLGAQSEDEFNGSQDMEIRLDEGSERGGGEIRGAGIPFCLHKPNGG